MNRPPESFTPVPMADLQAFGERVGAAVGMPDGQARLLARLLAENDLRGVFSHGSQNLLQYGRLLRDGRVNAAPAPSLVQETPTSVMVDGDGGLGYFAAVQVTERVIDKAKAIGMAAGVSRNHNHFGAAGIYTRMMLGHDLIGYSTSGHQLDLQPGEPLIRSGGGSPMSFLAPTLEEPPVLLDVGVLHGLYDRQVQRDLAERAPSILFRNFGLGQFCQSWGGLLTGLRMDPAKTPWTWPEANQGALILAFRIDLFAEPAAFKAEMDEYVRAVRRLEPLPGYDATHMPGGLEAEREAAWRTEGIPVGERHRQRLQTIADELGLAPPWEVA